MKRSTILVLMAVILFLTACGKSTGGSDPRLIPTRIASHPFDVSWDDRAIFREGLIEAEQPILDQLPGATVYHIDLEIPGNFRRLQGREQVLYTNREDEPLDEIYFRLFPNTAGGEATVSALTVDGQNVEPVYEFLDSAMRLPLPVALQPGERIEIEMDFEVKVAREMEGNYGLFGYFDDILALDEFYPVIPVYDDEGWNVKVPPPNGDLSYYDASFYLVRVTAPADLTVVASGVEIGREHEGRNQVLTFAAGPARSFYIAASDRYVVISKTLGETVVNCYVVAGLEDDRPAITLQQVRDALKSFGGRWGAYPYTEFDVVSTPMLASGVEYPGMIALATSLYESDSPMVSLESTVAHEVGHQWFYNIVGSDQVDEPWLDEALVQYVTGIYYHDTYGARAERDWRDWMYGYWSRAGQADIPIGLPSGSYEGSQYGPIVYGRGPLFVVALEEKMGRETFDGFLRDYAESNKWGIGTGDEFKRLAEQHCQCDLTPLFEEWVYEK
jgi:aminopeptidase N